MTKDDILNMPAGREMDKLVMEWVTEFTVDDNFYIPAYSTDIAAAWEVTGKFWSVEVNKYLDGKEWRAYVVRLSDDNKSNLDGGSFADTAPLAICRAALLAVMDNKDV